jgi:hypothetical protein
MVARLPSPRAVSGGIRAALTEPDRRQAAYDGIPACSGFISTEHLARLRINEVCLCSAEERGIHTECAVDCQPFA